MNVQALKSQLLSIRAAADAALSIVVEEEHPELQARPDPATCNHPEGWRQPMQTMGKQGWFCRCGYVEEGGELNRTRSSR